MNIEFILIGLIVGFIIAIIVRGEMRYREQQEERKIQKEYERAQFIWRSKLAADASQPVTGWPVTSDYDKQICEKFGIK